MDKKPTTFYIADNHLELARQEAAKRGLSLSNLVYKLLAGACGFRWEPNRVGRPSTKKEQTIQ